MQHEDARTAAAPCTRSSSRSRMIVANADVGVRFSRRASRYGRSTSPARAGSRKLAANPMTVVSERVENRVGADRRQQRLPAPGAQRVGQQRDDDGDRQQRRDRRGALRPTRPPGSAPRRKNASSPSVSRRIRTVRSRGRMRKVQSGLESGVWSASDRQTGWRCRAGEAELPANSTTRSPPSLWENVSYCSCGVRDRWGTSSIRSRAAAAGPGRAELLSSASMVENVGANSGAIAASARRLAARPPTPSIRDRRGLRHRALRTTELTVVGEDRADIAAELRVHSRGFDDAEAKRWPKQTEAQGRAGRRRASWPQHRLSPQRGTPDGALDAAGSRAACSSRLTRNRGRLDRRRRRRRRAGPSRGESAIGRSRDACTGTQRGGDAGGRRTPGAQARRHAAPTHGSNRSAARRRSTSLGGELQRQRHRRSARDRSAQRRGRRRSTKLEQDRRRSPRSMPPARIAVASKGLRTEARIDGRDTESTSIVDRAGAAGDLQRRRRTGRVTPPPGGYKLDAVASERPTSRSRRHCRRSTATSEEQRATGAGQRRRPDAHPPRAHGSITIRDRCGQR